MTFPWKKKVPQPRPVAAHRLGFSLEYWRGRPDLVNASKKLYATRFFQDWLAVLHYELPLTSTIEAVVAHRRLLRIIELMAEHPPGVEEELEADFGAGREFSEVLNEQTTNTE